MNRFATILLLGSFSLTGCAIDATGGSDDSDVAGEATASTAQAVSWETETTYSCTSLNCSTFLGVDTNRTCFMSGITGQLTGGTTSYPAGANVVDSSYYGGWELVVLNPVYNNISVRVTCIPNLTNRVSYDWDSTSGTTTNIPASSTGTRQCFLGRIYNRNSNAFNAFDTNVHILPDSPSNNIHVIGGTLPSGTDFSVSATCVDVPTHEDWSYGNGTANTVPVTTTYNPAAGGFACGLTGIGGEFNSNTGAKGAVITYNGSTRYFVLTLSPWTGGYSTCVN